MKKVVLLVILFVFSFSTRASHLMGGEITWQCLKSGPKIGQYVFTLVLYRDCNGAAQLPSGFVSDIMVWNHPSVSSIPIALDSMYDVSPICNPLNSGNAALNCTNNDIGAVQKGVYISDTIALPGIPVVAGWHFTWASCCRNGAITNGFQNDGFTLRAAMYPYDSDPGPSVVYLPADPCFDSSPVFKEEAKTILCTGFPFSYSHNAADPELDELKYAWGQPLDQMTGTVYNPPTNPAALPFTAPYTVTSPLPGNPTLDSITGEIAYDANLAGFFVTCVRVQALKCNQVIAEIYREVQVVLIACPTMAGGGVNNPPSVDAPFTDPISGVPTYETTVYAGDLVTFNITGTDIDQYPGGVDQELTMEASGGQFASDYISTTNCFTPPCATFNNGSGVTPPFSASGVVSGVFEWQTSCDHLSAATGCGTTDVFTFLVKVYDDFCPANGITIATIKITVVPPVPDLRCVSVLDNGDVELTWKFAIGAPPTAEPYFVYQSDNFNGPYTLVDSVFFPDTTFKHAGAGGDVASKYYFLGSDQSCGITTGQQHSDTLQSIFMDVKAIASGVVADVNWNPIHIPLLPTSATDYALFYKKYSSGFDSILSTPLLTYQQDAELCNYLAEFYVEIPDASGCVSKSSIGGVNLIDNIAPATPIITDVSVDASGKSVISWLPSSGADSYAIYFLDNTGVWITIDSVFGNLNTSYTFGSSTAMDNYETFQVRALDSCGNAVNASMEHNSINLKTDLNACNHTIQLDWNEYINWSNGLSHYQVFVEETDLSGGLNISQFRLEDESELFFENIIHDYIYDIYVIAYNADSTFAAKSNVCHFVANLPKKPDFNYIEYASVNHDNGYVEINCRVDETAIIDNYRVFRSLRDDSVFQPIGIIPYNGTSSVHYTDKTVATDEHFYQYQVYPIDTCGQIVATGSFNDPITGTINDTSYAQTILLQTEINLGFSDSVFAEEYTNTLNFNEYEKWLGNVAEYRLYRSVNREPFNLLPIYTWDRVANPDELLQYIDVVTEFGAGNGRFCYYIEAIEGGTTPYGPVIEGSYSNISCVSQTPILFVPNTFTPNGDEHNEVFLPVTFFVSEIGYSFVIYNRSGMEIFATNDPSKGWDGNYLGNPVQDGNYVYHVQYINGVGNLTEKTDIITLVR